MIVQGLAAAADYATAAKLRGLPGDACIQILLAEDDPPLDYSLTWWQWGQRWGDQPDISISCADLAAHLRSKYLLAFTLYIPDEVTQ